MTGRQKQCQAIDSFRFALLRAFFSAFLAFFVASELERGVLRPLSAGVLSLIFTSSVDALVFSTSCAGAGCSSPYPIDWLKKDT